MFYRNFEKFKQALKKREEERYEQLKEEVRTTRDKIEYFLTLFFESTASKAQTSFSNLQMYKQKKPPKFGGFFISI